MGVTIEQYHVRIGIRNNFVTTKAALKLDSIIWNTRPIIVLLTRAVYLLRCIVVCAVCGFVVIN